MKNANTKLSQWLKGAYIDKITYYITGWELSFTNKENEVDAVLSKIELIDPHKWAPVPPSSPIDLRDTNEYNDTLIAIVLFTVINRHPINTISVDDKNNLIIKFENQSKIRIPSDDGMVDITWSLKNNDDKIMECVWQKVECN
ncbi:hypothetical protein [Flammeovirga sp. SJP92]|uniref:hypothetical protein n=1 Tax=Flammeovirga sp. SJP92 TaxID=1775430 RepID=UPI000786CD66|nr:hypothetical protein [Flammeovirga sp. SJP92]KXX70854.1 hypothetical protein AVL50_11475 [Flammeovirga sp. SJP92]